MQILFDHSTPAPLRHHLREHTVHRSAEKGWELLENGELIRKADEPHASHVALPTRAETATGPVPPGHPPAANCRVHVAVVFGPVPAQAL